MTDTGARNLPDLPDGDEYNRHLNDLIAKANGFVYHGDRAFAVIDAVKALRANPDLARALLGAA